MTSKNVGRVSDSVTRQIETENAGLRDKAEIYEWNTKPLGELLELIIDHRGKTPNKMGFDDFHNYGHPVLSAKHVKTDKLVNIDAMRFANENMYKKWMKVEVQKGDVALTSEAPMGEVFYLDGKVKYVLGQRIFGLRVKKELIAPLYLTAWLTSRCGQEQLAARASGSTVLGIKQSELLKIEVDVPPYEVQVEIAKVRYNLSKKIELNHQINQTLEQMAQALFKSWFVDFDPVKAKISAKEAWINLHGAIPATDSLIYADYAQSLCTAAMSVISGKTTAQLEAFATQNPEQYQSLKATADLFPDAMQESEFGDVPEEWELKPLYETAEYINGAAFKATDFSDNKKGLPIIKIAELKQGISQGTKFTLGEVKPKYFIDSGDVLYSWSGSPETSLEVFKWHGGKGWLNQHIFKLNFNSTEQKHFAYFLLKQIKPLLIRTAQQKQTTGLGHVTVADMKRIKIVYPNNAVLKEFSQKICPLYEKSSNLIKEVNTLTQLRDTLLPKLLSGELSVNTGVEA